jgi:hypothetical protein
LTGKCLQCDRHRTSPPPERHVSKGALPPCWFSWGQSLHFTSSSPPFLHWLCWDHLAWKSSMSRCWLSCGQSLDLTSWCDSLFWAHGPFDWAQSCACLVGYAV